MNDKLQLRNISPKTRRIIKVFAAAQEITAGEFVTRAVLDYAARVAKPNGPLNELLKQE